jgi:A/G-specific adenine glycosylase
VWVSEVMLQQTRVPTVIPYFKKFIKVFPDVFHLAKGTEAELLKLWEGMGYYNRVRNLHRAAMEIVKNWNGKIPDTYSDLISLPGIGDYVASAILAFGFKKIIPVVDGNVMRVMSRYLLIEEDLKTTHKTQVKQFLAESLDPEWGWQESEAFMELGALICLPTNPSCGKCPLHQECIAYQRGKQAVLPVKKKKRETPVVKVVVGVIMSEKFLYIQKRSNKSHLGGLWEFPGGKIETGEDSLSGLRREVKEETGMKIDAWQYIGNIKHEYSHFRIDMDVYFANLKKIIFSYHPEGKWISIENIEKYAFPKANHKIFKLLKKLDILEL